MTKKAAISHDSACEASACAGQLDIFDALAESPRPDRVYNAQSQRRQAPEVTPRRRRLVDWRDRAACAAEDTPTHPTDFDATRGAAMVRAIATCADCPVLAECRTWAAADTDYIGVAGGRTWTTYDRRAAARTTVGA